MPRAIFSVGVVGPSQQPTTSEDYPVFDSLWGLAGVSGKPIGQSLQWLREAMSGEDYDVDPRLHRLSAFDAGLTALDSSVSIEKICGCGPVQLLLLTDKILVTVSPHEQWHGLAVTLPGPTQPRIVDVAGGECHYACCDAAGRLYTWGWSNEYGQLGTGYTSPRDKELIGRHEPHTVPGFGHAPCRRNDRGAVVDQSTLPCALAVACGRNHTVVLCDGHRVFSFGRGHRGQLGLATTVSSPLVSIDMQPVPRLVPKLFGHAVESVVCGTDSDATIVVLETGAVVVFGDNVMGSLGTGIAGTVAVPTSIALCSPPLQYEAAVPSSALYGTVESCKTSRRIRGLNTGVDSQPVSAAACCATHSALMDHSGTVYTAGLRQICVARNAQPIDAVGSLGRVVRDTSEAMLFLPMATLIDFEPEDSIVCGTGFTALLSRRLGIVFVAGTVSLDGRVLTGQGDEACSMYPIQTGKRRAVDIAATGNGALLIVLEW